MQTNELAGSGYMATKSRIQENIGLFSEALMCLSKPPIDENEDFYLDSGISSGVCIVYKFKKRCANDIMLSIIFSNYGIQVDIDEMTEAIDWSKEHLRFHRQEVVEWMIIILTSTIKIVYKGQSIKTIYFLNKNNEVINSLKRISGINLFGKVYEKQFRPIYDILL